MQASVREAFLISELSCQKREEGRSDNDFGEPAVVQGSLNVIHFPLVRSFIYLFSHSRVVSKLGEMRVIKFGCEVMSCAQKLNPSSLKFYYTQIMRVLMNNTCFNSRLLPAAAAAG